VSSSVIPSTPDTTAPECRALPALRGLSALVDCRPKIIIDSREQPPLCFTRLPSIRGTLYSGDYSLAGLEDIFAIERKSVDDLVGCCVAGQRERFEHELHRMRGCRFKRLVIVGSRDSRWLSAVSWMSLWSGAWIAGVARWPTWSTASRNFAHAKLISPR
jgi:ERCC4-type nuclease